LRLLIFQKLFQNHKKDKAKMKKNSKFNRGFSLIEVLVTLLILSFGIAAVTFLMAANIQSSIDAKNQIIASQLAQEGAELVRNLKDNRNSDLYNLTKGGSPYNNLRIDMTMSKLDSGPDKRLYLNGNFYTHSLAGTSTKFFRTLSLEVEGDATETPSSRVVTALIYVTWNNEGFVGELSNLTNCNTGNKCVSVVSKLPDLN
jgi:prepilin-type N-terminal cleavage/methylation domain-containing protein